MDESQTDSTLRAWVDLRQSYVSPRLKHFSGYQVWDFTDGAY